VLVLSSVVILWVAVAQVWFAGLASLVVDPSTGWTMTLTLTKLEAAERQLKEAIRMLFERRDPAAVHTLVFASHQVLYDLCASSKNSSSLQYSLRDYRYIPEDQRQEWYRLLNSPANFFKHADRDPNAELTFDPRMTEAFLLDATFLYQNLTEDLFHEGAVYRTWFFLKYPQALVENEFSNVLDSLRNKIIDPNDFTFMRSMLDLRIK